jgi:hypothetical protein
MPIAAVVRRRIEYTSKLIEFKVPDRTQIRGGANERPTSKTGSRPLGVRGRLNARIVAPPGQAQRAPCGFEALRQTVVTDILVRELPAELLFKEQARFRSKISIGSVSRAESEKHMKNVHSSTSTPVTSIFAEQWCPMLS